MNQKTASMAYRMPCQPVHELSTDQSPASVLDFPSPQLAESPHFFSPQSTGKPAWKRSWGFQGETPAQAVAASRPLSMMSETPIKGQGQLPPRSSALPASPSREQKSRAKIRRLRTVSRSSSLSDDKVLLQSELVRSQSSFMLLEHFILEGEIGRSQYSEVFRARHKGSGELYAVKRSTRRFASKAHRDRCMHEMAAVSGLPEHPNIIAYYRAWQQAAHFFIQMALCEGGSLAELLNREVRAGAKLPEERIWQILSDIAQLEAVPSHSLLLQGLEFLHQHDIMHLDIKPDNIFLDTQGRCKIGDFGLAIKHHEQDWEEGDGDYLAPELLTGDDPTYAADIYSAGATLYECCTGVRLADSREGDQIINMGVSPALQSLVLRMLQDAPTARPTARELSQKVAQHLAEQQCRAMPSMERVASLCHGLPTTPARTAMSQERQNVGFCFAGLPSLAAEEPSTPDMFSNRPLVTPVMQAHTPEASQILDGACSSTRAAVRILQPLRPAYACMPLHPMPPMSPFGNCVPDTVATSTTTSKAHPVAQYESRGECRPEDTAYCKDRQLSRNHWSRKAIQFPTKEQHDSPSSSFQSPSASRCMGSQQTKGFLFAKPPGAEVTAPFTAMRSPFEAAAIQDDVAEGSNAGGCESDSPLSWLATRSFSSLHSTEQSLNGSDSSAMEELRSTVRLLSMSNAEQLSC